MSVPGSHIDIKESRDLPPYLASAFQEAAQRALELGRKGYTPYPGQRIAALPAEKLRSAQLAQNTYGYEPEFRKSEAALKKGMSFFPRAQEAYMAPYQRGVIDKIPTNAKKTFEEGFLPELQSRFFKENQSGSSRHQGMKQRVSSASRNEALGHQREAQSRAHQAALQSYDLDKARALETASLLNRIGITKQAAQVSDIEALKEIGQIKQEHQQRVLEDAYNRWKEGEAHPYERLREYFSVLQGIPFVPSRYATKHTAQPSGGMHSGDWMNMMMGMGGDFLGQRLFGGQDAETVRQLSPALIAGYMARSGQIVPPGFATQGIVPAMSAAVGGGGAATSGPSRAAAASHAAAVRQSFDGRVAKIDREISQLRSRAVLLQQQYESIPDNPFFGDSGRRHEIQQQQEAVLQTISQLEAQKEQAARDYEHASGLSAARTFWG